MFQNQIRGHAFKKIIAATLALMILLSGVLPVASGVVQPAFAAAIEDSLIDPALQEQLDTLPPDTPLEVVIVYEDLSASSLVRDMAATYYQMEVLPMAGAILTVDQIKSLATTPGIYSLTLNQQLDYLLAESVPFIGADQVWETYGQTGGNTTVAVVDSGIDATHPDLLLGSKVIQNVKVLPFQVSLEDQAVTDSSSGHGTHVAGTIGGNGYMSEGYYKGVAPDVKLVGLGAGEVLFVLTAVQAYDWILQHHAEYNIRVISNSWGSSGGNINIRNPVVLATYEAYKLGILSVFAAGNDGGYDVMNPYSLAPWVLSVAAGTKEGELAEFSSRGLDGDFFKHPDITAPGVNIYSTRSKTIGITALDPLPNPVNPDWTASYTVMSGTSMATPHVSGAAALLFSSNPQLSPDQVISLLNASTTPMPSYMLHEAGYGYLNALAAYASSIEVTGNLDSFLSGDRLYSIEDVLGFNPDEPFVYDEYLFTGLTPVGATEASAPIDHTFEVPEEALYVDVLLTWTPQIEDAYDIEVLDPEGRVAISSGNGLDTAEAGLFVPEMPGTYTLRIYPFAAAGTQYEALVKIAYGEQPDYPPNGEPAYDRYLGVVGVYKDFLAVGIAMEYFRSGDLGYIVFSLASADGIPLEGAAADLQVIYTDRNGDVVYVDNNVIDDDGGEYVSLFAFDDSWTGDPGSVTASFAWKGTGSMRSVPTQFYLNHLDTSIHTQGTEFQPGDEITFSGEVAQVTSVAGGSLENTPVASARVTIKLLDGEGNALVSTQAVTDLEGKYNGSLTAPAITSGPTTLVAEATYQDSTAVLGPDGWYGKTELAVTFPGNTPPNASLSASRQTDTKRKNIIHIEATASDPDGVQDIATITLTLKDAKGRTLKRWDTAHFSQNGENSRTLVTGYKVSGASPWTLTLWVTDIAGETASTTATVTR